MADGGESVMPKRVGFIAETGNDGTVSWVWRFDPQERKARPVGSPAKHMRELDDAWFSGAPAEEIVSWFRTGASDGTAAPASR